MKHIAKGLFSVVLLMSMTAAQASNQWGRSFLLGGNVGNIQGGGLVTEAGRTHRYDSDKMYGCFSSTMEYDGSTKSGKLGTYLSPINNNVWKLGQSSTTTPTLNTADTDVFNVFFLIDENYEANVTLKPVSKTFTTNLSLFVGLDEFVEGLWFDVNLPIVYNKREVKISEAQITAATGTTFATGYFTAGGTTASIPYTTFKAAMVGDKTPAAGVASNNLQFCKIDGARDHTKVGNVTAALGYDFLNKENMHLGVGVSALINGNGKSDAVYMFEPSVGTGGRHGLGARVDGHIRAYENDDAELNVYLKANVHHLFDATVKRTYDFTDHGKWSRYLLFKEMDASTPTAIVANAITHGTTFSTLDAKVGIGAMYEINLMGQYTNGNLVVSAGYGLFGHSAEKHKKWVSSFTTKFYGAWAPSVADLDAAVDIEAIATDITIDGGNGSGANSAVAASASTNHKTINSLDKNSAMTPSALVHTVYGDVSYKWDDSEWEPSVGVGAGASFAQDNKAISQWSVQFHGGLCF